MSSFDLRGNLLLPCDVHVSGGWLVVVPFVLRARSWAVFDDPRASQPAGDLIKFFNTPYIESIGRFLAKLFKLGVDKQRARPA